MLDQGVDEAKGSRAAAPKRVQGLIQLIKTAEQELLLVGEMDVERGATDIGASAHFTYAHVVPATLQDQTYQRIPELAAGALHAPVEQGCLWLVLRHGA